MSETNSIDSYSLSAMQQGMLYHHISDPDNDAYMMQLVCRLYSNVDEEILLRAWETTVERHSVLRTSFRWEGLAAPQQMVHSNIIIPVERADWSTLAESEKEEKLRLYLKSDWKRGFDLTTPPLLRLLFVRAAESEFIFIFSNHHTILDGRSRRLLLEEVMTCYRERLNGKEPALEIPKDYRQYIDWLDAQDFSQSKDFWHSFLDGLSTPTSIAASLKISDSTRTRNRPVKQAIPIPADLTANLYAHAGKHNVSINTIIQCVWGVLLSRYCGQDDVIFGATRACRHSTIDGAQNILGPFINTLPVRVCLSKDMSVLLCLLLLRNQQISVREHEHSPLVKIQQWSGLAPGTALFDTIVVFENTHLNVDFSNFSGSDSAGTVQVFSESDYPLSLEGYGGRILDLRICYDPSLFDEAAINRMCGHMRTLFEELFKDPDQSIVDVQMLTKDERRQILTGWGVPEYYSDEHHCLDKLFESQAERTPDAIALVFEDQKLTYAELNRKADKLANYLQTLRIKPESLVGICMARSPDMIVAILGILKAGGAYVPLDPEYPEERLNYILSDSNIHILITQERLKNKFHIPEKHSVIIDSNWQKIEQSADREPTKSHLPNNLAYIIYTSGSTGLPKGVMIEHGAIAEHCVVMKDHYHLSPKDKVLQFASYNFDASVEQIFSTLITGACLVLIRTSQLTAADMYEKIVAADVTVANFPPAYWSELVHYTNNDKCIQSSLRLVIVGGDVLTSEVMRKTWRQCPESLVLINAYGPTEAVVTSTLCPLTSNTNANWTHNKTIPIGRATANTQLYILDAHAQPLPINVPGELYIGGCGLARGYLNRPELTDERFVYLTANHDHFSIGNEEPPASSNEYSSRIRVYKTGDLVRWLPDGNIEFLGRIDHQVKIRGFRIELGEIEAALIQHPSIQDAVVVARDNELGDKQLLAYIVPFEEQPLTVTELRDLLKAQLPYYMIPASFVILDTLPLTPSGKVNRLALPAPKQSAHNQQQPFVAPRDKVEQDLIKIWEQVLGVSPISVTDNFFDLGGHSLLAVRLMDLIRQRFAINLHLNTLWFDGATVEYLAGILRKPQSKMTDSYLVPIVREGKVPPLFLVHTVGAGNLFHYDPIIRLLPPEQPIYGLLPQGLDDNQRPHTDIRLMAAHCVSVMRELLPQGPFLICGYSSAGIVAYEMAQQLRKEGFNDLLLIMIDTINPILTNTMKDIVAYMRQEYKMKRYRALQERTYHLLLTHLGLSRLRKLKVLGESHRWAMWSYKPEPYPGDAVLVEAIGSRAQYGDTHLGWENLVRGKLDVDAISGKHGFIVKNEQAEQVAQLICGHLKRFDEKYDGPLINTS